jgi:hypothetical protein
MADYLASYDATIERLTGENPGRPADAGAASVPEPVIQPRRRKAA